MDIPTASSPPASPAAVTPRIGVVFNPRSRRNQGLRELAATLPDVHVAAPERRSDLRATLEDFRARNIDCIAISGGDGTVRDVLTAGLSVYGDTWPELAVLPAGKTNALAVDLGAPKDFDIVKLVEALADGRRIERRPLIVRELEGNGALAGFVFGAGVFTTAINAGQDAHRLGAFDSIAVAATAAWGVLQALFGTDRNLWRRGVPMTIRVGEERADVPRSRWGDPARRLFVLAATIENFPAGVRPFGSLTGMKYAVMDHPRRRVMAAIPAIVAGWESGWLVRNGIQRGTTDRIEIDVEGNFILDGEAFPAGRYEIVPGPALSFVAP